MQIAKFDRRIVHALLASTTLLCGCAQAHAVWVAQRAGEWALVLGEGPADDSYKPAAVKRVQARGKNGKPIETVKPLARERNIVLDGAASSAAVAVTFEDGYWSQQANGAWVAAPKSKTPGARKAGYYLMYTTTLLASLPSMHEPFGHPLEIVPLTDPMTLKKGETLAVRVLFEGQPLSGAHVTADYVNDNHAPPALTDASGEARIVLHSSGLNVLKTSHSRARADRSEADEDGWSATLAFQLPQPKED